MGLMETRYLAASVLNPRVSHFQLSIFKVLHTCLEYHSVTILKQKRKKKGEVAMLWSLLAFFRTARASRPG